jgi:hypothetical protein
VKFYDEISPISMWIYELKYKIKKKNILYPEFDITSSYEKKDDGHQFHQYQQNE